MRKVFFAIIFLSAMFAANAFSGIDCDIQAGFSFPMQKESYTDSDTNFKNKTFRIGAELANFNTFESGFGFFESFNFQFYRYGKAESEDYNYTYNAYPFFCLSMMFGPAYQYKINDDTYLQIGAGLHYSKQSWESDDYTYTDTNVGIGAIFNYKYKLTYRLALAAGISVFWDFNTSKSYEFSNDVYSVSVDDFSLIGIEPHILFNISL